MITFDINALAAIFTIVMAIIALYGLIILYYNSDRKVKKQK